MIVTFSVRFPQATEDWWPDLLSLLVVYAMRFTAGMTMAPVVLQSCPFLCKQVDPVRVLYLDRLNPSDYNIDSLTFDVSHG